MCAVISAEIRLKISSQKITLHLTVHLTTTFLLLKVIWNGNSFFFWKRRRAIQIFCLFMCGKRQELDNTISQNEFFFSFI